MRVFIFFSFWYFWCWKNLEKIAGIFCTVQGVAYCHWTKTVTESKIVYRQTLTKTLHFEGKDVFLTWRTCLLGGEAEYDIELQRGVYRYNFECQLSPLLPASIKASHGYIRYSVDVLLEIPWNINKEFKQTFSVVRRDDLNFQPELMIPVKFRETKRFGFFLFQSEPLEMTVFLPFTGFVPGQSMRITIAYNNKSNTTVSLTQICLRRVIRFNRWVKTL